jgi:glycosyltransferase involved in cell wall biosynthesis
MTRQNGSQNVDDVRTRTVSASGEPGVPGRRAGNPRVSVVMPTHNRARELPRSIRSVLSQTFGDFELLIVDDASTDATPEVVARFRDPRIRYIRNELNVGGAEARNIGIRASRGTLVAFQDSDDEWRCQKLETSIGALDEDPALQGVFSSFWEICGRRARYVPEVEPPPEGSGMQHALLWGNFVGTPTVVVRRSALEEVGGFDPNMPRYQDWDLFLRLAAVGRFMFIPEPLVLAYVTEGSITMNEAAHKAALKRIYRKHEKIIAADRRLRADWLYRMGDSMMSGEETPDGRQMLYQAVRLCPLNPRYLAKACFATLGSPRLYGRLVGFFQQKA